MESVGLLPTLPKGHAMRKSMIRHLTWMNRHFHVADRAANFGQGHNFEVGQGDNYTNVGCGDHQCVHRLSPFCFCFVRAPATTASSARANGTKKQAGIVLSPGRRLCGRTFSVATHGGAQARSPTCARIQFAIPGVCVAGGKVERALP